MNGGDLARDVVEAKLFGASDLGGGVERREEYRVRESFGEVVAGNRLDQSGREGDRTSVLDAADIC